MKKLFIFLCLFSISIGICQTERKTFRQITKDAREKSKDSNSELHKYTKELDNKAHYNTSYGKSKYDKEINWSAGIDENNVGKSLEKFRAEKRREEVIWYSKVILSVLGISGLAYFIVKFLKRRLKHSS